MSSFSAVYVISAILLCSCGKEEVVNIMSINGKHFRADNSKRERPGFEEFYFCNDTLCLFSKDGEFLIDTIYEENDYGKYDTIIFEGYVSELCKSLYKQEKNHILLFDYNIESPIELILSGDSILYKNDVYYNTDESVIQSISN